MAVEPSIRSALDTQIIADQERTIARCRLVIREYEDEVKQIDELVCERFNPADDDSHSTYVVIENVATFIESLPCECTPEQVEDHDACARCRTLGRIGDDPVAR
jgi:hypothetical protein